jgi:long-chain acyl-CoA synthetase
MFATSLYRAVRLYGDAPAFVQGDAILSWSSLVDRALQLAAGLKALGVRPGDRVAAVLANGFTMVELSACACLSEITIVPLNFRWTAGEIVHGLQDSGAKVVVLDDAFREVASEAARQVGVTVIDAGAGIIDGSVSYASLFTGVKEDAIAPSPDRVLGIYYTGGTTGRSKGVMLTERNISSNACACMAEGMFGEQEVMLHASPAFHIAGALVMFASFLSGARGVLLSAFEPGAALRAIETHKVTQALLVPTMLGMVLDHPAFAETDTTSFATLLYGAAPMPPALLKRAMTLMPWCRTIQLYGMTETAPTSSVLHSRMFAGPAARPDLITSVGRPIFGTELAIIDADGREVERGAFGEIAVRGPGVMAGYWGQAEATAEAIVDGWMRTGDGGLMDADGFVFLADRIKDMIISGGENVFSIEVENAVTRHPAVRQCAVIGVPHPVWGEAVHAVVVLHEGAHASEEEIVALCRDHLAAFKVPRSVSFRAEPLPISGAGKVLKRELREPYWAAQASRS